jgi:hypothetical protein
MRPNDEGLTTTLGRELAAAAPDPATTLVTAARRQAALRRRLHKAISVQCS